MAAIIGKIPTRVLVAFGDSDPVEVAQIEYKLSATREGDHVFAEVDERRWRRRMALGFLRIAWSTLTTRGNG